MNGDRYEGGTQGMRRSNRGAALSMVAVGAIILMALGVGFVSLTMILGGNKQLQNAADAGTLAVVRDATSTTVDLEANFQGSTSPVAPASVLYDNFHLLCEENPWSRGGI